MPEEDSSSASPASPSTNNTNSNNAENSKRRRKRTSLLPLRPSFQKFLLFVTKTRYYYVATNRCETVFRLLKIDRTLLTELSVVEDETEYSRAEYLQMMRMIDTGNRASGGLTKLGYSCGLIGFIRFLEGYYIVLISKRSPVAIIGGHTIYHVDNMELVPVSADADVSHHPDEQRYVNTFLSTDLRQNFYYSYTYDLTHTLQHSITKKGGGFNDMYVWNHYLWKNGFPQLRKSPWIVPIIHGFVDQGKISVFGRPIYVTLIARRSRFFAGTRFLKRGINHKGQVANDVETEQIVQEAQTTLMYDRRSVTSFVQHRGSAPFYWKQEIKDGMKPPISLQVRDPFYSSTALHFDNMFRRYGFPILVFNLVKKNEKTPRESVLSNEFAAAISYLNLFLPSNKKLQYIAWDMAKAAKSHDEDVLEVLADLAERAVATTKIFHGSSTKGLMEWNSQADGDDVDAESESPTANLAEESLLPLDRTEQAGVVRTNCVDCLDRTNAAQFMIGKCAFGYQLYSLGVIDRPQVAFDSDAVNLLNEIYQDQGDTIALQYGGSELVNTMTTYRKSGGWSSHSRDVINTIKRFYSNSVTDFEKQDAINIFLGFFVPEPNKPTLWELTTDYYLHNDDPRHKRNRRHYQKWWTKESTPKPIPKEEPPTVAASAEVFFSEYYPPNILTFFDEEYALRMNSTANMGATGKSDLSPFKVRESSAKSFGLDIGGVKQWVTFRNKSRKPAHHHSEPPKSEPVAAKNAPEEVHSGIYGSRGLNPTVSENEKLEYAGYLQQFESSNIGSTTIFESREYLSILRRTYLVDYEITPRDVTIYARSTNVEEIVTGSEPVKQEYYYYYLLEMKVLASFGMSSNNNSSTTANE